MESAYARDIYAGKSGNFPTIIHLLEQYPTDTVPSRFILSVGHSTCPE